MIFLPIPYVETGMIIYSTSLSLKRSGVLVNFEKLLFSSVIEFPSNIVSIPLIHFGDAITVANLVSFIARLCSENVSSLEIIITF